MKHSCYFLLLSILLSCSSSLPNDILPPAKMQIVLWDVLRADEMSGYFVARDTVLNHLSTYSGYYQQILKMHHITKKNLNKSLQYYQNHPVLFKVILDSLQSFGERQQKKADSSSWSKPAGSVMAQ